MGDELDGNPDAAAIREFHAAARRRQVWIMFITAGVLFTLGAVLIILMLVLEPTIETSHSAAYRGRGAAGEVKLAIYGGAAIVLGCIAAWNGWRIHKGARYG
jgi:hypothetical protein